MWKVITWTTCLAVFFSLFQAAVLSKLIFLPVIPDLVLLIILYVSFMNGSVVGTVTGFFSGLILDFFSLAPIGLNALIKTVTGFISGRFTGLFNGKGILIPATLAFIATIGKLVLVWLLSIFFGTNIITYSLFDKVFYYEVLLNTILAPLIFSLLSLFSSFFIVKAHS